MNNNYLKNPLKIMQDFQGIFIYDFNVLLLLELLYCTTKLVGTTRHFISATNTV